MEGHSHHARQGRFSSTIRAVKSFSTEDVWTCKLWTNWFTPETAKLMRDSSALARAAAQGIVEEGKLSNKEAIAQEMADALVCSGDRLRNITECAINLYSKDTFLYAVLNAAIREYDESKVRTLGPMCVLINAHLSQRITLPGEQTVYRGMTLTDEMIQEYSEAVGQDISWPAFTSTSKNRDVAELFAGNTLCIITLNQGRFAHGGDISHLSHMPDEDEFLLSIGFMLLVEKVDIDPSKAKHLIHLRSMYEDA